MKIVNLLILKEGRPLYPATPRDADIILWSLRHYMIPAVLIFDGEVVGEVSCSVERGWNVWRRINLIERIK
jgi:hypothetical protein